MIERVQYIGPVTPEEMAAHIDRDEPGSTIPTYAERIAQRLTLVEIGVMRPAATIIEELRKQGFVVVDQATGIDVLP